ncbi:MAG: hypothetical protein N3D20_02495 [Candidatus Pacearchaeota archaeon]|nr:hypothetical protein [Candidatus Pacearchaeota archaeon]
MTTLIDHLVNTEKKYAALGSRMSEMANAVKGLTGSILGHPVGSSFAGGIFGILAGNYVGGCFGSVLGGVCGLYIMGPESVRKGVRDLTEASINIGRGIGKGIYFLYKKSKNQGSDCGSDCSSKEGNPVTRGEDKSNLKEPARVGSDSENISEIEKIIFESKNLGDYPDLKGIYDGLKNEFDLNDGYIRRIMALYLRENKIDSFDNFKEYCKNEAYNISERNPNNSPEYNWYAAQRKICNEIIGWWRNKSNTTPAGGSGWNDLFD